MNARILPPEEWPRLNGTEAEVLWPHMNPAESRVLVVENDEGQIVATWSLLRVVHAECLWCAPEYRGKFGVAKRLLRIMRETAAAWKVSAVFTGAASPHVEDLIRRFGGVPLPFKSFTLPIEQARRQKAMEGTECRA